MVALRKTFGAKRCQTNELIPKIHNLKGLPAAAEMLLLSVPIYELRIAVAHYPLGNFIGNNTLD
jgi:hypothetical protein